jgi:hypothetical protein
LFFGVLDFSARWTEMLSWKFLSVVVITLTVAVMAGYLVGLGARKNFTRRMPNSNAARSQVNA